MSQQNAEAGWYRDVTGTRRWWDGIAWTAHVAPEPLPQLAPPTTAPVPAYAATAHAFLPEDPGGAPGVVATPGAASGSTHRSALALDTFSTAASAPYLRPVQRRDVAGAITFVLAGLACLAGGVVTFELAMPHGGLVWTGGLLFGSLLVLRGVGELVRPGSSQPRPGAWVGSSLTHPYAAHRAAKEAAAHGPGRGRFVSGWGGLVCLLAVVGVVYAVIAWPLGASSAADPIPASSATSTASATKHTAADTGPWVPDRKHDWTPIGTTAAYATLSTSSGDCDPGTSCQRILVASKHACSDLRVRAAFYGMGNAVVATTTLHLRRVRAGKAVPVRLEAQGFLFGAAVTSIRCM